MNARIVSLVAAGLLSASMVTAKGKSDKKTVKQLKADIGYLASDELEGRHTGSEGEKKAAAYIIAHYQKLGISAFKNEYRYPFSFVNGKEIGNISQIKIDGKTLRIKEDAFPLPFSANKKASGEAVPEVLEKGSVWVMPLYKDKEEADDAHFDWEKAAFEQGREAVKQGATGVIFYDNYGAKFPPEFNSKSEIEPLEIPAAFITNKAYTKYISNSTANLKVDLNVYIKKTELTGTNIAAYINNKAPYTVVIGAHYDHLGYGEDGNSLLANAKKNHMIHNGADDNASGTAALMQMAGWVKDDKLNKYNYLFIHFSAEELGLIGSKNIIKDAKLDSSNVAYMINMDMVGRLNDSTHALTVGGVGTSPVWGKMVDKNIPQFRIGLDSAGVGPSDHTSFYNTGIPVLFFFTGTHKDYHKPTDDADKINYEGEAAVMNYIYNIVEKMEKEPKPAYLTTKQSTVGKVRFKVTLGIMPDYSFQEGGVRVDGVTDGKPAIKAGIKAGDIIIQLGDNKINGMQTYMEALGKFKENDKTQVTIQRNGKEMKLPIEFK